MRILFLSHYFPPEVNAPATRTFEHCREWARMGHEVTVLTCAPNHPMGELYPGYRNRWWSVEQRDGIRVVRLKTYITANEGFVKRTWNYVFFMLMCILAAPFAGRAEVVISTSPQFFNGLAGYFVSRMKRAPWVLEIRDLWPESILAVGAVKNRHLIRLLEGIETFMYRRADLVVSVTKSFLAHIGARGVPAERMAVIRNGVDLSVFSERPRDEAYARELGLEGKFVGAYVGTHGMAHGLDTIIEAAELLRDDPGIAFLMVGDGAERARLEQEVARRRLPNVLMLGQQPKEAMPRILSITDASLVLLKKLPLFETVIPSKIFESMATKKPIVLGVEGEVKGIIEEAGSGLCIEPESALELADALRRLAADSALCRQLGDAGAEYVARCFDRRVLASEFEGRLRALAGR